MTQATWNDWIGADVVDRDGGKIGTLDHVYMDRSTGKPEWLALRSGLLGMKHVFVPVDGVGAEGNALQVPYEKDYIKGAPGVDVVDDSIDEGGEGALYAYYDRQDYRPWNDEQDRDLVSDSDADREVVSGDDDAMTLSEEKLVAGTRSREAGRARLRKYVVTENVTTTVPVRREKAVLEREPITDANRDAALTGPDIAESEHEVVLHEEEPVVDTEVVPKERVRLSTATVTDEETVAADVREERLDVEGDVDVRR
jgi:uncharacterized protein (TIGR02271 family)